MSYPVFSCGTAAPKLLTPISLPSATPTHVVNFKDGDEVEQIMALTNGRGRKERMRRLMAVVESGGADLSPLVMYRFKLDDIEAAYELFAHQHDGVMKVATTL